MKKLLFATLIFVIFSCNKQLQEKIQSRHLPDDELVSKERDDFFLKQRTIDLQRKKPDNPGNPHNPPPTDTTGPAGTTVVILLDFDGQDVSGTFWAASYGITSVSKSSMTASQIQDAVTITKNHYAARFSRIEVTTDEQRFFSYPKGKRVRVVVTDSWEWYGRVGGVAYINSIDWTDDTPCFVFGSLYGNDPGYISHAMSHEASHCFGNRHQSVYDASCVKTDEYKDGVLMGEYILGIVSIFIIGPSSVCCTCKQDDVAVINAKL